MRGENEPASGELREAGGSFEDARVEPIQPGERDAPSPTTSAPVPGWTKRLSVRGKAGRALTVALAVLVALAALLLRAAVTLPPQLTGLLTPAPTRTPTPGQFSTGAFEPVPLPMVPSVGIPLVTPSPRDPATAYACVYPQPAPTGGESPLWVTHNAGQTWSRAPLPAGVSTGCDVELAWDGSHRVVMSTSTDAPDQNAQACAYNRFFLSDDGATWRSIALTSLAPLDSQGGDCFVLVTARHLFLETFASMNGNQGHAILERSDDDGQTWQRADHGLEATLQLSRFPQVPWFAQPLDATGDALVTLDTSNSGGIVTQADFWVTRDAGAHWQRATADPLPDPPFVVQPNMTIWTEPAPVDASRACHCVVVVNPFNLFNQRPYYTRDLSHWMPVPPLPVKGASAQVSGVYATWGMTGDGRLLALGPDPDEGVPSRIDFNGLFDKAPPALWAWDSHRGRWEVARTSLPCLYPLNCYGLPYSSIGVSVVSRATGQPPGTWFWISAGGTGRYFRVFIPAA